MKTLNIFQLRGMGRRVIDSWFEASKKRYLKHEGFCNDVTIDTILELRKLSGTKCIRYFDSIEGFLNW